MTHSSADRRTALLIWILLAATPSAFSASQSAVRNPSSPTALVRKMITAIKTGNASAWASCLSSSDRKAFYAMRGSDLQELERKREELSSKTGKQVGRDAYEFGMFEALVPFSSLSESPKTGAPQNAANAFKQSLDLMDIRREAIWDDTYAEVTVVTTMGPLRLMFIKERGVWKFAEIITQGVLSGAIQISGQNSVDDNVDFALLSYANIDFRREDCRATHVKEFRPSQKLSRRYADAFSKAPSASKWNLWAAWNLTGDPEAAEHRDEIASDPNTSRMVDDFKRQYDAGKPCVASRTTTAAASSWRNNPAAWFNAASYNPIALGAFIRRFRGNREWVAKAQLKLADLHAHSGVYAGNIALQAETAVKEYQAILDNYPEQQDLVIQAKTSMARLYWDNLGQKDKAMQLWKELKAIRKLRPDSPLARGARTTPTVLVRDPEKAFGIGIFDFAVADDGSLYVVKATHQKIPVNGTPKDLTASNILHYSPAGKFISTFTAIGIPSAWTGLTISLNRGQPELLDQQKILLLGPKGERKGELVNQFDRFQFFPDPQGFSGMGSTPQVPLGFYLESSSFEAFYPNSLRKFNYSGDLISKIDLDYCNRWEPNMVRLAKNSKGEMIVAEPACGAVLRIGPEGIRSRLSTSAGPGGSFTNISDMYVDGKGRSYILDVPGKSVLKFDAAGKFVSTVKCDAIDEYSHVAADDDGRVYVFGRPATFSGAIIVFNADGTESRRIGIDYSKMPGMHKQMVDDLEVSGGKIYAAIDRNLVEYDSQGKQTLLVTQPPMEYGRSGMRLAKDRKGRIAFLDRGQILQLDQQGSHSIADLKPNPKAVSRVPEPTSFGFDADGSLLIYGFGGLLHYDIQSRTAKKIEAPKGVFFQNAVFSPTGGILANGFPLQGNRTMQAWRIDSSGSVLGTIQSAANAKQSWKPSDVAVDAGDNIFVFDQANNSLLKFDPTGKPAGEASLAAYTNLRIQRIRLDKQGNLYLMSTEMDANVIQRLVLADLF